MKKIILVLVALSFSFTLFSCTKKGKKTSSSTQITSPNEKIFADFWDFDNSYRNSEEAFANVSMPTKEAGKNNLIKFSITSFDIIAKTNIRIKSASYIFENIGSDSIQYYDYPNNIYDYDEELKVTYLLPVGNEYRKTLGASSKVDKTIYYEDLIIKKGEHLHVSPPKTRSEWNEKWFFYNFNIDYEAI